MDLRLPEPPEDDLNLVSDIFRGMLDHYAEGETEDREIIAAATPGQRAVYTLWIADGEVSNGGFGQFLTNPGGALISVAIAGAALVEARTHEQILRDAAGLFPAGEVPTDYDERNEVLDALPLAQKVGKLDELDGRWYEAEDEFEPRLRAYIAEHPGEFFRAG